jgi:hypothetical protein
VDRAAPAGQQRRGASLPHGPRIKLPSACDVPTTASQ